MEEIYIVAWSVVNGEGKDVTDYWERCETLKEAQEKYNKVLEELKWLLEFNESIYTASIAKEIQSTEAL